MRSEIRRFHIQAFQCSSASRKFLNLASASRDGKSGTSFSALQRAENSSIISQQLHLHTRDFVSVLFSEPKIPQSGKEVRPVPTNHKFQCSSASRKFLNAPANRRAVRSNPRFSALQRAENSSIATAQAFTAFVDESFSALQRAENSSIIGTPVVDGTSVDVSVLFSEPKIPQSNEPIRAEIDVQMFQCSSASRKFLNSLTVSSWSISKYSFSALQRAENSSILQQPCQHAGHQRFSALQRAENSSIEQGRSTTLSD